MKNFHRLLALLGGFLMVGGIVAAGLTYRDMRAENLFHSRTTSIELRLDSASGWESTSFSVYRPGVHLLILRMLNGTIDSTFSGTIDVRIADPTGVEFLTKRIDHIAFQQSADWTTLAVATFSGSTDGVWTLQARVSQPDERRGAADVFILPPQRYDIEAYLYAQTIKLIVFGVAAMLGFGLIVLGSAMMRRRNDRGFSIPPP
jgi:hypothetical protein